MHPQGWLRLYPAPMLELPEASSAEPVASQNYQSCNWTSENLADPGIEILGILRRDAKGSME